MVVERGFALTHEATTDWGRSLPCSTRISYVPSAVCTSRDSVVGRGDLSQREESLISLVPTIGVGIWSMRSEEERDREVAKRFFKLTGVVVGHTPGWVGTSRYDSYHLLCPQH